MIKMPKKLVKVIIALSIMALLLYNLDLNNGSDNPNDFIQLLSDKLPYSKLTSSSTDYTANFIGDGEFNGTNELGVMEKNKVPRNIILWTTWRSGSTYTGELLANALPNTFYSIEPLHWWRVKIYHENNAATFMARRFLRDLLRCSVSQSYRRQVRYLSKLRFYMRANAFLSNSCKKPNQCKSTTFVNGVCRQANIHVMKLLRLSLKWAWPLLEDDDLDLQIIYLARDPRAVLNSRSTETWCMHKTCRDPMTVCSLFKDDLQEAKKMMLKFPRKFKLIQYEKVSGDLLKSLENIMSFVGLKVSDRQLEIISRTKRNPNAPHTTRKDSKEQLNRWRLKADFNQVLMYQRECQKPISELGLRIFNSKMELLNLSLPLVL
ncbi:carbohydrate sulfotransferase 3-like [Palaemon carinicauda]|uniref:carbohydrate sulfotransferase 3-like n=1 Tax=Palaemon carinicauda TaxID=392227 RepID=UPI0035B5708C